MEGLSARKAVDKEAVLEVEVYGQEGVGGLGGVLAATAQRQVGIWRRWRPPAAVLGRPH